MVCESAADNAILGLPPGRKVLSATCRALAPEIRRTARPPSPMGVAMAAIVSSVILRAGRGFAERGDAKRLSRFSCSSLGAHPVQGCNLYRREIDSTKFCFASAGRRPVLASLRER